MRWISGTIIILILGSIAKLGFLVYAMYVLLGILLLSRFMTHQWSEGLVATRSPLVNKVDIGNQQNIEISLINTSAFSAPWILFEESFPKESLEQMPRKLSLKGKGLGITALGTNETHLIQYRITFKQRGYYQLGPLLVETGDLFGLHRTFRIITDPDFVLVIPQVIPLRHYQIASKRPIGEIRIAHRLFEDPTRIAAVRPYQPGDPLNRIHWSASARTGTLHSRIYDNSCVAGATLLLDFHDKAFQGSGSNVATELAVTTAASLANALFEEGHQVGLVCNGRDAAERIKQDGWTGHFTTRTDAQTTARELRSNNRLKPLTVPTRKGTEQLTTILETLGRLEPSDGLQFAELIQEAMQVIPRDATVIPILREVTPESAIALGMLKRRGYSVTVIFIQFDEGYRPEWAMSPSWAEPIIGQGIDFITISNEQELAELSTQTLLA